LWSAAVSAPAFARTQSQVGATITRASLVGECAQKVKPEARPKPCARARARAALIAAGRMLRAAVVPIDMNSTNGGLYKRAEKTFNDGSAAARCENTAAARDEWIDRIKSDRTDEGSRGFSHHQRCQCSSL